jgi:hypothetical protein
LNPCLDCILHISDDRHGFFDHSKLLKHPLSNCLEAFNFLNLIVAFLLNKHRPTLGGLFLTQQPFQRLLARHFVSQVKILINITQRMVHGLVNSVSGTFLVPVLSGGGLVGLEGVGSKV